MKLFLLSFGVLLVLIFGMSIGVIMGRKPLKGSCGGVGKALGEENYECDICGGDPQKCESEAAPQITDEKLSYDASRRT